MIGYCLSWCLTSWLYSTKLSQRQWSKVSLRSSIWWWTSTNDVFSHSSMTETLLLPWIFSEYVCICFFSIIIFCRSQQLNNLSSRGSAGWFCPLVSFSGSIALEMSVGFHYNWEKGCDWFIGYHNKPLIRGYYTKSCHLVDFLYLHRKKNHYLQLLSFDNQEQFRIKDEQHSVLQSMKYEWFKKWTYFRLLLQQDVSLDALQKCKRSSDMLLQVFHILHS